MHLGIAQTALAAWLDARAHNGRFLLRIEDIDSVRRIDGAADALQRDLEWLGLDWDGPVVVQSERQDRYHAALERLQNAQLVYPCTCSRKEIREASAPHGPAEDGPRYPGFCRERGPGRADRPAALRVRTPPGVCIRHSDRRLGAMTQDVHGAIGDFVLRRADGLWAYQLAVTVDDLEQGITSIVRGEDLAHSTPRQLMLRAMLDPAAPPLQTLHVPLRLGADGRRLAKRDQSGSVAHLRLAGEKPGEILGRLAMDLGLLDRAEAAAARDLVPRWAGHLESEG